MMMDSFVYSNMLHDDDDDVIVTNDKDSTGVFKLVATILTFLVLRKKCV